MTETLLKEADNYLKYMQRIGSTGFDCSEEYLDILETWAQKAAPPAETLNDIRAELTECQRCGLYRSRTNIVFGKGNPGARVVFVGEGPGFEEDKKGEPFVGAAGSLLTKIISAVHMTRDSVYICNVVKCRPPGNRNPEPGEIAACISYLKRQISAIQPDFICALGSVAARSLLDTKRPISMLRGKFHDYAGIRLIPTYHPAYLLRNPDKKRDVWEDMKMLIAALER